MSLNVNEFKCKPNKLRVNQGREFYSSIMQKWFDDNGILIHSTHNGGKSVAAERFIRTLKGKIYKMTAPNSRSYLDYLDKLVDEYNNIYHRSIVKNLLMLIILL